MDYRLRKASKDMLQSFLRIGRRNPSEMLLIRRAPPGPKRPSLRVVSYNVMSGWLTSIERIADELEALDPDVVALQEIDHRMTRSGRVDQTAVLAERLSASSVFCGAIRRDGGDYGIALLSRLPIASARRVVLKTPFNSEVRVAIDAMVDTGAEQVRVVAVHIDHLPWSAPLNAWWLSRRLGGGRTILAGDLNAPPWAPGPRMIARTGMVDLVGRFDPGQTFASSFFTGQLDYVFVDSVLAKRAVSARRVASNASDHWPVVAEIRGTRASEAGHLGSSRS